MPTNPFEPPKEAIVADGPFVTPYRFRWWHVVIGLLAIASLITLVDRLLHLIWIDSPGPPQT